MSFGGFELGCGSGIEAIPHTSDPLCGVDRKAPMAAGNQVKMPVRPKLELARNNLSEMGRGREGGMHGLMLDTLAKATSGPRLRTRSGPPSRSGTRSWRSRQPDDTLSTLMVAAASSCAPKRYGGVAIAGSSPTTSSRAARLSSHHGEVAPRAGSSHAQRPRPQGWDRRLSGPCERATVSADCRSSTGFNRPRGRASHAPRSWLRIRKKLRPLL